MTPLYIKAAKVATKVNLNERCDKIGWFPHNCELLGITWILYKRIWPGRGFQWVFWTQCSSTVVMWLILHGNFACHWMITTCALSMLVKWIVHTGNKSSSSHRKSHVSSPNSIFSEITLLIVCVSVVIFTLKQWCWCITAVCAVTSAACRHTLHVRLSAGSRHRWALCCAWASDDIHYMIWCNTSFDLCWC